MGCTSPLYRIPCDSQNFKLLPKSDRNREKNGGVFFFDLLALNSVSDVHGWNEDEVQILRCGQCTDCRLAYSRDWAVRCSLEASLHEHNYFVTLTYDDYTIPSGEFVDYNGDIYESTLRKRDVQLFLKSLREWERTYNNNTGIKVFYCGEYGGLTSRPHYHLCLFGCSEIPDLRCSFKRGNYQYYKSSTYESFWNTSINGVKCLRGFVDITDVSFDTVAYTARYCMKKQQGKMKKDFLSFYNSLDATVRPDLRLQPFIGMSLKPGIASGYYKNHKFQIQSEDLVKYQKKYELFQTKPPRYFDKLFDAEDPDAFAEVKEKRKQTGIAARKAKRNLFSESEFDRQKREEMMNKLKEERYYVRGL